MNDKHIQKLADWAARTPEVSRIFIYTNSRRPDNWPLGMVGLAIEVVPKQHGPLSPFSLWFFEQSRFWSSIFNATSPDFQFSLEGYYPDRPEVIGDVERTGILIYRAEAVLQPHKAV